MMVRRLHSIQIRIAYINDFSSGITHLVNAGMSGNLLEKPFAQPFTKGFSGANKNCWPEGMVEKIRRLNQRTN